MWMYDVRLTVLYLVFKGIVIKFRFRNHVFVCTKYQVILMNNLLLAKIYYRLIRLYNTLHKRWYYGNDHRQFPIYLVTPSRS